MRSCRTRGESRWSNVEGKASIAEVMRVRAEESWRVRSLVPEEQSGVGERVGQMVEGA